MVIQSELPKWLARAVHCARRDNARAFHDDIAEFLADANHRVTREWEAPATPTGRRQFIDLHVVTPDGETWAVELDRVTPRRKSIAKLESVVVDRRFVILRSPVDWMEL